MTAPAQLDLFGAPVTPTPRRRTPTPRPPVTAPERPYRDIPVTDAELRAAYVTPARARLFRLAWEQDHRPANRRACPTPHRQGATVNTEKAEPAQVGRPEPVRHPAPYQH